VPSARFLLRAYPNGSVDAVQDLALTYAEIRDPRNAMHYFLIHLERAQWMISPALFPGIGIERGLPKRRQFLAKCMIDPIALLHLGAATKYPDLLDGAAVILNSDCHVFTKLHEFLVDFFSDAVKLPKDLRIAALSYGYAALQAEKEGADTTKTIHKFVTIATI
jgi:hypothetical protein